MLPLILITTETDPSARLHLASEHLARLNASSAVFSQSPLNLSVPSTDLFLLQDNQSSIGIDHIRQIIAFFSTKPSTSDHKSAILLFAEKLTPVAQHTLLKILEEPPEFGQIILVSPHTHIFLPTILSRCRVIRSNVATHQSSNVSSNQKAIELLKEIKQASPGTRIALSDSYNQDRSTAQQLTTDLTHHFRDQLKDQPSKPNLFNLTLTLYVTKLLKQNVNPKLALDHFFLNLKLQ